MTTAEADRLVHYMPILVRDGGVSEWERKFAATIINRSRNKNGFTPTAKQIAVMDRMVTEFQRRSMTDDVLDEGDGQ